MKAIDEHRLKACGHEWNYRCSCNERADAHELDVVEYMEHRRLGTRMPKGEQFEEEP